MENASRAFLDAVRKSMRQIRGALGAATINPDDFGLGSVDGATVPSVTGIVEGIGMMRGTRGAGCSLGDAATEVEVGASVRSILFGLKSASAASRTFVTCARSS